tara:strand:- start:10531 stop:10965 length:435 start_codon:yes stop_codon:yes gene_type:complete
MEYREIQIEKLINLTTALNEVVEDLSVRVIPEHEQSAIPWDYVRAEIWEDTGRVIFFPAYSKSEDRIDISSNYILCSELISIVNEIDASELPDEDHDIRLKSLINNIAKEIVSFFSKKGNLQLRCFNQDGHQIKIPQLKFAGLG